MCLQNLSVTLKFWKVCCFKFLCANFMDCPLHWLYRSCDTWRPFLSPPRMCQADPWPWEFQVWVTMLSLTTTYSLFHLAKMAPAHLVLRMKSNFFGTQNVLCLIIKIQPNIAQGLHIIACRDDTMKVRLIKRNTGYSKTSKEYWHQSFQRLCWYAWQR